MRVKLVFDKKAHSIPVSWGATVVEPLLKTIEDAFSNRLRLMIEYVSSEDNDGKGFRKERLIEVHK